MLLRFLIRIWRQMCVCHLPDSLSLWVLCILQHTACDSSHWAGGLYTAGTQTHSGYELLWTRMKQDWILSFTSQVLDFFQQKKQIVSLSYCAHDVYSQVWQSCGVFPQHLSPHSGEQLGPVEEKNKRGRDIMNLDDPVKSFYLYLWSLNCGFHIHVDILYAVMSKICLWDVKN